MTRVSEGWVVCCDGEVGGRKVCVEGKGREGEEKKKKKMCDRYVDLRKCDRIAHGVKDKTYD